MKVNPRKKRAKTKHTNGSENFEFSVDVRKLIGV